jgi:hypothetical protein
VIDLQKTPAAMPWLLDPRTARRERHAMRERLERALTELRLVHQIAQTCAASASETYLALRLREAVDAADGSLLLIKAADLDAPGDLNA